MDKPAARIGDLHDCKMVAPGGVPHVGGPIIGGGCQTVLIDGKPAATLGDSCTCIGALDKITSGSTGVFFEGRPAARQGDQCAHGGVITGGSDTVVIGEWVGSDFWGKPSLWDDEKYEQEPTKEEKTKIITQAIENCIVLLEKKQKLVMENDPSTMAEFKRWFGLVDDWRTLVIKDRIKRQLIFFKNLTLKNFDRVPYEIEYRNLFGYVYATGNLFTIYLGGPFWNNKLVERYSRETILIHESSHFEFIGNTEDFGYEEECDLLAQDKPDKALYNADSYAFFITV